MREWSGRRGVWSLDEAVRYFHHLFDFDGRGRARDRGLLPDGAVHGP